VSAGGHRRAGDRQVGGHRGHRTPSQPSGWPRRTPRRTGRPRRCGTPRPSARPLATVSGPPHAGSSTAVACGSSGPGPGPAAPARVGRSAVAAARTTGVHASGRVRSAAGHPSRTADRRRHRHGHRHQRGHVCRTPPVRTPPVRRAVVPEAADGQSADRSGSSKTRLLLSRPALRVPSRTVTDADVAVCSRGSWSAHANAMGPGYLYCARRGFASDNVCTLPIVSCSVGPPRRARGIRARGIMVSCCSGGCGSNDLPRQGQNLDPAVAPWAFWFASPACDREPLCGRRGPRYTLSPVLIQAVRDTPRR
jgi:hypothetical protein